MSDPLQDDNKMEIEEQATPRSPFVDVRQWTYELSCPKAPQATQESARRALEAYIEEHHAAPLYQRLAELLPPGVWTVQPERLQTLQAALEAALKAAQDKIQEATEIHGETEVREAMLARAQLLAAAGDKPRALTEFASTKEKTVGSGQKIELHFTLMRLALALQDNSMYSEQLAIARELVDAGGDWERRNLFSVYEAVGLLHRRELSRAARILLKSVATFTCTQLFDYNSFVRLAVTIAVASTDRTVHREQIVNNPDVLSVVDEIPGLRELAFSVYECAYARFFRAVVAEVDRMQADWLLGPAAGLLLRELRVVGYRQFLTSYRSVKLASMATAFGVGVEFLDEELSRFIGVGRLNCQIDRVAGVLSTTRPGERQRQYGDLLRQGDLLLDRVNKLTRIGST